MRRRGFTLIELLVVIAIIAVLAGFAALNLMQFGRHVVALGANMEAARRTGVPVKQRLVMVYVLSGVAAAVAGIIIAARLGSGSSNAAVGFELEVIAAVVLSLAVGSVLVLENRMQHSALLDSAAADASNRISAELSLRATELSQRAAERIAEAVLSGDRAAVALELDDLRRDTTLLGIVVRGTGGQELYAWRSAVAVNGAIVGELFGAFEGLGYMILDSRYVGNTVRVFLAAVVCTLIGWLLLGVVALAERALLPWHVSMAGRRA